MCTEFSPTGWVLNLSSRSFMGMVKARWCYLHSPVQVQPWSYFTLCSKCKDLN